MKTLRLKMLALLVPLFGTIVVAGQNQQQVPGDDFSLEGALELFKKSESPEEFERMLNTPNSKVNNLDLNGDGEIDYIRVVDYRDGNVHAFVMQAVLDYNESQDVAVIELEKLANGKAVLQITGDEDVYGIETIIEPTEEVRVNAGTSTARVTVNVWAWPSVQYVYSPYYSVWVSPWHWRLRPVWWISWRPIAYYDYYSYWQPYRSYYNYCNSHRIVYAREIYHTHRTTSVVYYNRHDTRIKEYRNHHRDDRNSRNQGYANSDKKYRDVEERGNGRGYSRDKNERNDDNRSGSGKQWTNENDKRKERSDGYARNEDRQPNTDRRSSGKRDDNEFGKRSNSVNKQNIPERRSNTQQRTVDRPNKSTNLGQGRGSQPRESKSIERRSSGGNKSTGSNGRGNSNSGGKGRKGN